jgi:Glycosyltransferase like family
VTDMTDRINSLTLELIIATWNQPEWERCVASWQRDAIPPKSQIISKQGILDAYQVGYDHCHAALLAYLHDDLLCLDRYWLSRVLAEFDADPTVAIVGFAGAPGYGHPAMYSQPYHHSSLGRVGFASNMVNAEQHGGRFTGSRDVVVLDGMALIVRRSFLDELGGWEWRRPRPDRPADSPDAPFDYFLYAEALCFHALRRGLRVRQVGIAVDHLSGRSTGLNPNLCPDFEGEHRRLWDEFRDVLPARVSQGGQ